MRDLERRSVAIEMGEKAHALMPKDYRPCTLLGAVHMELHHFEKGHEWYEKHESVEPRHRASTRNFEASSNNWTPAVVKP
jgi:hypothetical protein